MSDPIKLILMIVILVPWSIKLHRAGVERYRRYDRLAFWNSLSDEDKENVDWYIEP